MPKPRRPKHSRTRKDAVKAGFRSGFEQMLAGQLIEAGVEFEYETLNLAYPQMHKYRPDFILGNGVIIEAKGRFTGKDRTKHLAVKKAFPDLDIRFVFMADNTLGPNSKTRYSEWCDKNGFQYCFTNIPACWYE